MTQSIALDLDRTIRPEAASTSTLVSRSSGVITVYVKVAPLASHIEDHFDEATRKIGPHRVTGVLLCDLGTRSSSRSPGYRCRARRYWLFRLRAGTEISRLGRRCRQPRSRIHGQCRFQPRRIGSPSCSPAQRRTLIQPFGVIRTKHRHCRSINTGGGPPHQREPDRRDPHEIL